MSQSKDHFDKHIAQQLEGFKCDICEDTLSSRNRLKENIFKVRENTIISSFFIKGKCTRYCWLQHPYEIKYCKCGSHCPFLESSRCRYFHTQLQLMWKGFLKIGTTGHTHEERTQYFRLFHMWKLFLWKINVTKSCDPVS